MSNKRRKRASKALGNKNANKHAPGHQTPKSRWRLHKQHLYTGFGLFKAGIWVYEHQEAILAFIYQLF
jgi:hypothetical protein